LTPARAREWASSRAATFGLARQEHRPAPGVHAALPAALGAALALLLLGTLLVALPARAAAVTSHAAGFGAPPAFSSPALSPSFRLAPAHLSALPPAAEQMSFTIALPLISVPLPTPAPTPPPTPAPPVEVAVAIQAPLSGSGEERGGELVAGARLAYEEQAARLAAGGLTVRLVLSDDLGIPDVGVENARRLGLDGSVRCVVGHLDADVALGAAEQYHAAGLAFVATSVTDPRLTQQQYPEIFRSTVRDDVVGKVAAWHARVILKTPVVYLVHDVSEQATTLADVFVQTSIPFTELTVYRGPAFVTQEDFGALLDDVAARDPDLLVFSGLPQDAGPFLKQMRAAGIEAEFMGGDTLDTPSMLNFGGNALLNTRFVTLGAELWKYPGEEVVAFADRYRERFGDHATLTAAQGYQGMASCLEALRLAAQASQGASVPPDRAAIVEAMRQVRLDGPLDPIEFDGRGELVAARYFVEKVTSLAPSRWGSWPAFWSWRMPP
jgi:branched-chain amino acid transport system substrate-binding protein